MYNSAKSRFYGAETFVMWEFEECPIPVGVSCAKVSVNISRAIAGMGYYGPVTLTAYGDLDGVQKDLFGFGLLHSPPGELLTHFLFLFFILLICLYPYFAFYIILSGAKERRRNKILVDLLGYIVQRDRARLLNVMLILGDISRHTGLLRAIRVLVSEGNCNVILSQPQKASGQLPDGVDTVWLWESLAAQGRMVSRGTGVTTLRPVSIEELLPKAREHEHIIRRSIERKESKDIAILRARDLMSKKSKKSKGATSSN